MNVCENEAEVRGYAHRRYHKRTSLQLKLPTTANGGGDIADDKPSQVLTSKLIETPVCGGYENRAAGFSIGALS